MEGRELPVGWIVAPIAELATKVGSGATPKGGQSAYLASGIPLIRSMNVVFFGFKKDGLAFISEGQAQQLSNAEVRRGDVLLNITGASIGRVTTAPDWSEGSRVNQHVCIIRPSECLDQTYLSAYLSSPAIQTFILDENYGVTRQALTKQQVLELEIPVPPLNEQRRIAAKLDTTLAAVDACRLRLDGVAAILKRFRQAVLAAATSGELTREWREERDREQDWEPSSIKSIAEVGTGSTPLRSNQSYYSADGMPWITSAATSDELITTANEFVTESGIKAGRLRIFPEGTLLVAMYGEGKTRGQVSELGIAATINQACAAIHSPSEQHLMPFIKIALKANYLEMRQLAEGGTQPNLNLSKIKEFPIRVPPKDEVFEICDQVELLLSLADQLEAKLATACRIVNRLTPALLAKAFRGELVPQDPNDEPASELLAKLKAKQSYAAHVSPRRRAKPPTQRQAMSIPDKDSIKAVILSLKTDRFSFDELRDQAGGDYESLKGVLFELLEEPSPVVRQVFDQEAKAMQLERIRP